MELPACSELDPLRSCIRVCLEPKQTTCLLPCCRALPGLAGPCRAALPASLEPGLAVLPCLLGVFDGGSVFSDEVFSDELRGGWELSCRWAELELAHQAGYCTLPLLSQDTEAVEAPRHRGTERQQAPGKSRRCKEDAHARLNGLHWCTLHALALLLFSLSSLAKGSRSRPRLTARPARPLVVGIPRAANFVVHSAARSSLPYPTGLAWHSVLARRRTQHEEGFVRAATVLGKDSKQPSGRVGNFHGKKNENSSDFQEFATA